MASSASLKALTETQSKQLNSAFRLLTTGNTNDALVIARRLVGEAPQSPDAYQLFAMCCADAGDVGEADKAFQRALELAPGHALVLVNYATMQRKAGRLDDALATFRQAADTAPSLAKAWIELGLTALQLRKHEQAQAALARGVALQPDSALAWHAMGNALRAQDEIEAAAGAFRKAVVLRPGYATAWANLGAVLRLLGRTDEALDCLDKAGRSGYASAELADTIAGTLLDSGRADEALARAKSLVDTYPDFAPGHLTLAHILWEYGEATDAGAAVTAFRTAVLNRPDNRDLRTVFARFLLVARWAEEALEQIHILQAAGHDVSLTRIEADALEALGQTERAGGLYEQLHRVIGNTDVGFLNAYTRHLLTKGDWVAAADRAADATRAAPGNQEAWSYLGTAWRLLDDPREHWLCDYEQLIGFVEVEPPPGFSSISNYLGTLKSILEPLHQAKREPVQQSLRGGSQTPGRLFGRPDSMISATRTSLLNAVERWMDTLPTDPQHPFLARKSRSIQVSGSWSVRLRSSGSHVNHIHPEGWLSSAFYVSLPPSVSSVSADGNCAGCIQFGQPPLELGLDLPPRRVIRPQAGRLALFPSYIWHGTVPFTDEQSRLTIAFDLVPAPR